MHIFTLHPDSEECVQECVALLGLSAACLLPSHSSLWDQTDLSRPLKSQPFHGVLSTLVSSAIRRENLSCLCLGSACSHLWWENAPSQFPTTHPSLLAQLGSLVYYKHLESTFPYMKKWGEGGLNALALSIDYFRQKPNQKSQNS